MAPWLLCLTHQDSSHRTKCWLFFFLHQMPKFSLNLSEISDHVNLLDYLQNLHQHRRGEMKYEECGVLFSFSEQC